MATVRFTIPKGSLEKTTFDLLEKAWYRISGQDRTYRPIISDPEIQLKILRPQEIPIFVAEGLQDAGITGKDWVEESGADVETILDLEYGKVRLVVAIPESFPHSNLSDLIRDYAGSGRSLRISTEYLKLASRYISSLPAYREAYGSQEPRVITPWWKMGSNRKVGIYLSFGATEAKPPEDADAIIDLTETGTTLQRNNLKITETIIESSAVLIANKKALNDPEKREKIYDIITLLKGVIDGEKKLHVFVNVRKENLEALLSQLPALKRPTVSQLSDQDWFSVNTVVDKEEFLRLLPSLRKLAQGLVIHKPHQILPLEEIAKSENHG